MEELVRFALLGLGTGAIYALTSQGLIVIYRGSGVLNFAHGAIGMVGAYLTWELRVQRGYAYAPALICGVVASVLIGVLTNLVVMRQLRTASALARVVASLGVLITLQSLAVLRYDSGVKFLPSVLPTGTVHLFGDVQITEDRLYLLGIALGATCLLWAFYKYTRFGLGTAAVAENERTASSLGWSPTLVATVNWGLGSGLSAVAAILIAPIVTLQITAMTSLLLAALAGALVAGFRSFPIAFAAGVVMGVVQTVLGRYVTQQGFGDSVPFLVVILFLVIGGRALPLRDFFLQKLPAIGTGRIRPWAVALGLIIGVLILTTSQAAWIDAATITLATGLILLSIVVLTGYAGQLSLAQYAIAGFGSWVAAKLVNNGVAFIIAVPLSVLATAALGIVFALPAVRTRGINLAVMTLGLGTALQLMLFNNGDYSGGASGISVGNPSLFGWDFNAVTHATRYALVALAVFTICALATACLRRSSTGRRLIAIRTNERAAAALGIDVRVVKVYSFALSAAFAALGGILLSFRSPTITFQFDSFTSISDVAFAMIGGIGFVFGPIVGGALAPEGLFTPLTNYLFGGIASYIPLIGGVGVILLVMANQNGIVHENLRAARAVLARTPSSWRMRRAPGRRAAAPTARRLDGSTRAAQVRVEPMSLVVDNISVTYGRTKALQDVSLRIDPGKIIGLIGPNGAGKTTLIDAVTGFAKTESGQLLLNERRVTDWSVVRRARHGVGRSFQSLELFEDSTVLDNLRAASDERRIRRYFLDLVKPSRTQLPGQVVAAVDEFGLASDLHTVVQDLSYGKRRLVAIARAVAMGSSVLLLDEPAAGLTELGTSELADLVRRLAADWGMAVLVIEHDMTFVMNVCHEIVVLDFGRKISEGTPAFVRQDPAVIAAYLGASDESTDEAPAVAVDDSKPKVFR